MFPARMNGKSGSSPEPDNPATVLCKLFCDHVSEQLCLLRKRELDLKGQFSCEGCPMDLVRRRQLKIAQEAAADHVRDRSPLAREFRSQDIALERRTNHSE